MVVHQNITNLAGYFHFLNVRKIPYVIYKSVHIKGNTILFTGVKTSHYSQDRTNLKFSIVNGVLKKVN